MAFDDDKKAICFLEFTRAMDSREGWETRKDEEKSARYKYNLEFKASMNSLCGTRHRSSRVTDHHAFHTDEVERVTDQLHSRSAWVHFESSVYQQAVETRGHRITSKRGNSKEGGKKDLGNAQPHAQKLLSGQVQSNSFDRSDPADQDRKRVTSNTPHCHKVVFFFRTLIRFGSREQDGNVLVMA